MAARSPFLAFQRGFPTHQSLSYLNSSSAPSHLNWGLFSVSSQLRTSIRDKNTFFGISPVDLEEILIFYDFSINPPIWLNSQGFQLRTLLAIDVFLCGSIEIFPEIRIESSQNLRSPIGAGNRLSRKGTEEGMCFVGWARWRWRWTTLARVSSSNTIRASP